MLSKRQKQALVFIKKYIDKHDYAPSLEEIKKHLRLSSVSTAHYHVQALENMGYLQKEENQPRALGVFSKQKLVHVPLLGMIAAGQPIEAIEHKEHIAVPQGKIKSNVNHFALRVSGESMIDENINDGDIVIVKKQQTAENGQKIVALINENEATLKKLHKEKNQIRLEPANPKFKAILVKPDNLRVQGVVVDVIKNHPANTLKVNAVSTNKEAGALGHNARTLIKKPLLKYPSDFIDKIICSDTLEIMRQIPDGSLDLVVTSPPYNLKNSTGNGMKDGRGGKWANAALINGYTHHDDCMPHAEYAKWQKECLKEMYRVINNSGAIMYNHKWRVQGGLLQDRQDIINGFPVRQIIIWKRKGGINFNAGYFLPTYEVIYLIAKPDFKLAKKANAYGDVWEFTQEMKNGHPAPFPVSLIERCISSTSAKIILDPFMGSGTTAVVAKGLGRHFIGIDISPEYCNMAKERLKRNEKHSEVISLKSQQTLF
jgi:modification methylase